MSRLTLVISDLHLCEGRLLSDGTLNTMEDFHEDQRLVSFFEFYSKGDFENRTVELVINGDFLNLIQVPFRNERPQEITETISLAKLESVFRGHQAVFDSLRTFNSKPNHSISYVVGNHDLEMLWPSLKHRFAQVVGGEVRFFNTHYIRGGVHIEHGHQLEPSNRVDPKRFLIEREGNEPLLNLPWGSLFILNVIHRYKLMRPGIDKVKPFFATLVWVLLTDFIFGIRIVGSMLFYFLKTRFVRGPFSSHSQTTWAIFSDLSLHPDLDEHARHILMRHAGIHTVIFGHTHLSRYSEFFRGKIYINTGTWNELTSLELDSFGRSLRLTYALIEEDDHGVPIKRHLKEWRGPWLQEADVYG